jgi:glutamyl-tRNA reductase
MKLCVTGVNHRTAPVSVREKLAFNEEALPEALADLQRRSGLRESLILSTCNRVEVAVAAEDDVDAVERVEEFLAQWRQVDRQWLQPHLYAFEGRDAVRHLFRVAASLDSMVVGEPQILGQLKSAYLIAKAHGAVGSYLETVLSRAFSVAKRVRAETEIGARAVSVSYAAVELAREIFGSLSGRTVLLLGAGKMSELAARHLKRSGASILVANRTPLRAEQAAQLVGGEAIAWAELPAALPRADIVITSTGASEFILTAEMVRRAMEARRNRPMFLIDIAVPRNIAPEVNELDGVFLYDIDDLQRVVENNLKLRLGEAELADRIVSEEVERLESWLRLRQLGPIIARLQEQLEEMRMRELERMRARLGALTPEQQEAIEALTRSLINKIAHGPITELKRSAESPEHASVAEAIRRMFGLP